MASNGGRTGNTYLADRAWVINHYDHCCICGEPVNKKLAGTHPLGPTLEHVIPLARGGQHHPNNWGLAHRRCNTEKGDRLPEELPHFAGVNPEGEGSKNLSTNPTPPQSPDSSRISLPADLFGGA